MGPITYLGKVKKHKRAYSMIFLKELPPSVLKGLRSYFLWELKILNRLARLYPRDKTLFVTCIVYYMLVFYCSIVPCILFDSLSSRNIVQSMHCLWCIYVYWFILSVLIFYAFKHICSHAFVSMHLVSSLSL